MCTVCAHVSVHEHVQACLHTCVHMYVHMHVCAHICAYVQMLQTGMQGSRTKQDTGDMGFHRTWWRSQGGGHAALKCWSHLHPPWTNLAWWGGGRLNYAFQEQGPHKWPEGRSWLWGVPRLGASLGLSWCSPWDRRGAGRRGPGRLQPSIGPARHLAAARCQQEEQEGAVSPHCPEKPLRPAALAAPTVPSDPLAQGQV